MKEMRYDYQKQDSGMTLTEGLAEYYRVHPEFDGKTDFLGQPRETVKAHDVCHVVFGLGATSEEELIVEVWTFLGCSIPVKKIAEAKKTQFTIELLNYFGPYRLIKRFILTFPRVARASFAALRMKKRWPHFGYEPYLGMPLHQIRLEFGIQCV